MKKNIRLYMLCTWFVLSATPLFAQLLAVEVDGKWGAIDPNGQMVIKPQYVFLDDFDRWGYALAIKDGKTGLLDSTGQILIPFDYDRIKVFSQNVVCAWSRGKCGLRRTNAAAMSAFAFDRIVPWLGFYRTFINGETGLLAPDGRELLKAEYDMIEEPENRKPIIWIYKNGKMGAANRQGELIVEAEYDSLRQEATELIGRKDQEVHVFALDAQTHVAASQTYRNPTLYQRAVEDQSKRQKAAYLSANPEAKNPRFQKNGKRWKLANAVGQSLIGDVTFYQIGVEEELGTAYGLEAVDEKTTKVYYIDLNQGKVLFSIAAKDIFISDFKQSDWARITIDSMRDALVSKTGEIKTTISVDGTPKKITDIGEFVNGMATINSGGMWGYINGQAQLAIPLAYSQVDVFAPSGLAIAKKNGQFGALNTLGKAIIPFEYDGINREEQGVFRVKKGVGKDGRWGLINTKGKIIAPFEYTKLYPFAPNGEATFQKYDKLGVIDTKGNIIMKQSVEADFMGGFQNGIALVGFNPSIKSFPNGQKEIRYERIGYIKRDGSKATSWDYSSIENFEEIWAKKQGVSKVIKDQKIGYIDYNGFVTLPPVFDDVRDFEQVWANSSGLAKVFSKGYYGYADHLGGEALPARFTVTDGFLEVYRNKRGLSRAKKGDYWGYMNWKGVEIVPFDYAYISAFSPDSVAYAKGSNGQYGLINQVNDTIQPFQFDNVRFLPNAGERIFQVLQPGEFEQWLDQDGDQVNDISQITTQAKPTGTKSKKYEYLTDFDQYGFAVIKRKDLVGLANQSGKIITKPQYQAIGPFADGKAWYRDAKTRKYGYLGTDGKVIIPAQFGAASDFGEGMAAVGPSPSKWGYIKENGTMTILPTYRTAQPFSGGYAVVDDQTIINTEGKVIGQIPKDAKLIQGFLNDRAIVESDLGRYHITPYGNSAYLAQFDDLTPYHGQVAFAKKGEKWELTRMSTELYDKNREVEESTITMSLKEMKAYLLDYGPDREIKTPYGKFIRDMKWEKVDDGIWRMINKDGNLINETIYSSVEVIKNKEGQIYFKVKASDKYLLYDAKGQKINDVPFESVKVLPNQIIKAEAKGQFYYIRQDGKMIWPQK